MQKLKSTLFITLSFVFFAQAQNLVDGIAAVVGKEIILRSEIEQHVNNYVIQNRINAQANPEILTSLRQKTLVSLVEQKLLITQAELDTVEVESDLLDQRVEERIRYLVERLGSEEKLEATFGNPMKKIKKDTRKIVNEQLLVEKMRQIKFAEVAVSRREVEKFYSQYQDSLPAIKESVEISHILKNITASDNAKKQALDKVTKIKARLDAGEDFATLATEFSQDPASAQRGGDLGLISRGDFVSEYETAAFKLNDGEMSGIVETQFGFHIIKMIERRGEKIRTRHILIMLKPTQDDEKAIIEKLMVVKQRALDGADFAELAATESDDDNAKSDRGKLGVFETDQLIIPQFKSVLEGMNEGEISDPFKTNYGYHIVMLEKRIAARKVSLKDDWEKLEQLARNFKIDSEYRSWIEKLKENVPIQLK